MRAEIPERHWRDACKLTRDHPHKLVKVNLPVVVGVGLSDHFVDLNVGQVLAQFEHYRLELLGRDFAAAVRVEKLEPGFGKERFVERTTKGNGNSLIFS